MPLMASHVKVFEKYSPVVLGGCASLERSAFILTISFPRPSTLGGYGSLVGLLATVRKFILCCLPPHPRPAPGFLEVEFLLYWPPPPLCFLPLLNCLLLECLLCLCFCGLPGEGIRPDELCLLPVLHCWTQWFFLPQPLHTVPKAGHSPWLCEHPHLPQVFLGGPF